MKNNYSTLTLEGKVDQILENQTQILKYIEEQKAEQAARVEIHNKMMATLGS